MSAPTDLTVGKTEEFSVDFSEAGGMGDLEVKITSPRGRAVLVDDNEVTDKKTAYSFTPHEVGRYLASMKSRRLSPQVFGL